MYCKWGYVRFFFLTHSEYEKGRKKRRDCVSYKDMLIYALLTLTFCCWRSSELLTTFQSHSKIGEKQKEWQTKRHEKGNEKRDNKEGDCWNLREESHWSQWVISLLDNLHVYLKLNYTRTTHCVQKLSAPFWSRWMSVKLWPDPEWLLKLDHRHNSWIWRIGLLTT